MKESHAAEKWTRTHLGELARRHFAGRADSLEKVVRDIASRHEAAWRSDSAGRFRPTPSMYALALGWELDKVGPNCLFCQGKVELPARPGRAGPSGPSLALGVRVRPRDGGLNVPQNLVLGHADCVATPW